MNTYEMYVVRINRANDAYICRIKPNCFTGRIQPTDYVATHQTTLDGYSMSNPASSQPWRPPSTWKTCSAVIALLYKRRQHAFNDRDTFPDGKVVVGVNDPPCLHMRITADAVS